MLTQLRLLHFKLRKPGCGVVLEGALELGYPANESIGQVTRQAQPRGGLEFEPEVVGFDHLA